MEEISFKKEKIEFKKKTKQSTSEPLYLYFSPRRMFSILMIIFIIYIFERYRRFIINDKKRNDPNLNKNITYPEETEKEREKSKVRLAIYFPPIQNEEISKVTSILVNSMSKQPIFDIYLLLIK